MKTWTSLFGAAALAVLGSQPAAASLAERLESPGPERYAGGVSKVIHLAQGVDRTLDQRGLDTGGIDRSGDSDVETQFDDSGKDASYDESDLDASGIDGPRQAAPATPVLLPGEAESPAPAPGVPPAEARIIENTDEGRSTGLPPGDRRNPYYTPESN